MAGKEQFDEFLGGCQKLPHDVHVMRLVSSRAGEIAAMTYSIENPQQTKLVFQKLPVHMRRRVMSHNVKRLPRRLREAHLNQLNKSGFPPKSKRPSRKYRRRPQNLLLEYNRRQRSKVWLETHIWHAKRFHMVEKWGYRIASHANDKCFRANYRAVAKHCLMQDISYYNCVEINGPEDVLKDTLKKHCSPFELTFAAKIYMEGCREGTLMFFKRNGYPCFPIGHVNFLWRPHETTLKTIWIWVHPSFVDDFLAEILSSFEFRPDLSASSSDLTIDDTSKSISYVNFNGCRMNLLKNRLNRFRLSGPLTVSVLTNSLQLPNLDEEVSSKMDCTDCEIEMVDLTEHSKKSIASLQISEKNASSKIRNESIHVANKSWHIEYYKIPKNMTSWKVQKQLWSMLKTLESPSQLPSNVVLGFTVLDPRFYLPKNRTKSQRNACTTEIIATPPASANSSSIWETEIRRNISESCVTTSSINKLRSENLVPGINNDKYFKEDIMAKIPIVLIQQPGNNGLSSGMDIILPTRWAMPFWLAFLYRCTRVGALRESKSIAFEYGNKKSADINDPDTPAYNREVFITKQELLEKYFRYPPNRRVNFVKLGISSPFLCEWKILMREWAGTDDYFVLRNRHLLSLLQGKVSNKIFNSDNSNKSNIPNLNDLENTFESRNCLIHVKVTILKRGSPRRFAIICMPSSEDLQKLESNGDWSGPVEKLNKDSNESTRKILRKDHLSLLKRLKRQRIRQRKALYTKLNEMSSENIRKLYEENKSKNLLDPNREIVIEQSRKMSQLYLPDCAKVRCSCDREVMGYVTAGDFLFAQAKDIGLGYVTLNSLLELIRKKSNIILVRNTQTRQYRFAKLEVTT